MLLRSIASAAAVLLFVTACASQPKLPEGQLIGEAVEPRDTLRFSVVDATPAAFFNKTLLVEATVSAVCLKKGCWMKVTDAGKEAMVRWESGCGGKYTFPIESVGKRVLIQGSFYPKQISAEDAEHIQEEAAKGVTIPRDTYEFNASAVIVLDQPVK